MRVAGALNELSEAINVLKKRGKTIGFVPTMGALHAGHLSLIRRACDENEGVVVSIFVNPIQFNNPADLDQYPRVLEEDLDLLTKYPVDVVFTPDEQAFYPEKPKVSINFGTMAKRLEGKFRKGHFEGVGIVVSKLLHMVGPDRAYFGLKDLQQFLLIRQMCSDLSFPTEIIGVETVREPSGLALSSRNRRLSAQGLKQATIIFQGLQHIKLGVEAKEPLSVLMAQAKEMYEKSPGFELEYLEAVNPKDLKSVEDYSKLSELAVCVAGYVEGVRLIDNLYLRLK